MLRDPDGPLIRGGDQDRATSKFLSDFQQADKGSIRRVALDAEDKTAAAVSGGESWFPIGGINAVDGNAQTTQTASNAQPAMVP
jgi:hypothetical protein